MLRTSGGGPRQQGRNTEDFTVEEASSRALHKTLTTLSTVAARSRTEQLGESDPFPGVVLDLQVGLIHGGGTGIRTLVPLTRPSPFQDAPLGLSGIPPESVGTQRLPAVSARALCQSSVPPK